MRPVFPALISMLAISSSILPRAAQAQTIPSPYSFVERRQEAGTFIGYMSAAKGRFGFGPAGGMMVGARYGVEISGPISLEGVGALIQSRRDVVNPGRPEGDRVLGNADTLIGTLDARLKFTLTGNRSWHRLAPFIVVGGGAAFDLAEPGVAEVALRPEDVFDFGTSFFGTLGIGTRFYATEAIALRSDAIFSLWKIDTPPGFSDPLFGFDSVSESEWARGLSISLSILTRW